VIPPGEQTFTAGGIAVTQTGEIWMSDAANHRVIMLNTNGEFERVIGFGAPSADPEGFDGPAGLAIDQAGNLYVADSGNRIVKKFSPTGVLLGEIGAGALGMPTSVAVDASWQVYVTDESAHVVSVFDANGGYMGSISQPDMSDPHSLSVEGDRLYVADRLAGIFVFQTPGSDASGQ
jgi:DNA-binding beta-propeller fold protein YncE